MKISYMLKREDFYAINERTLKTFYRDATKKRRLYIYPELNAIVTARPSRAVRNYLYTEFRVGGSPIKRFLVWLYARVLLNSGGLLATKSIKLNTDADHNVLIYPCNRKYRIFDFAKGVVSVVAKDGFPKGGLMNEIAFRTEVAADFVPGLVGSHAEGYTERIIDGCPVARMGDKTEALSAKAFSIWSDYIAPHIQSIPAAQWGDEQEARINGLLKRVEELGKAIRTQNLRELVQQLAAVLRNCDGLVPVGLSHGDLQPGNIWLENRTDKLYIIDWESGEKRSVWYDRALLFEGLRRDDGLRAYAGCRDLTHATVLLEDVVFRLVELCELPEDYGCKEFDAYVETLLEGVNYV